ncbi:MAG: 16S rRNA (cytidine(1402)-2'-O)-methyltransferase [Pseudohongiellaceae bacterium]
MNTIGILYVVATPIGNVADISQRAIEVLKSVDLIAAEDTRHSRTLLTKIEVENDLVSYHDFSDESVAGRFIEKLRLGESIALISDAGTPLISDPGFKLVRLARQANIQVLPVPGASALTAALCVAGIATDRFCFEGFLPNKKGAREQVLESLILETRTLVFYESPHRIESMVGSVLTIMGASRHLFIAREITKKFEAHFSGSAEEALTWLQADQDNQRGEFVVVLAGCEKDVREQKLLANAVEIATKLEADMSLKKAVALASDLSGARKNLLYTAMLELKNHSN